jgi:hypothetical protein
MNTLQAVGADVNDPPVFSFADISSASSWAIPGINFVGTNGIMSGTGNNNFSPQVAYTREQSIATFNNIRQRSLQQPAALTNK